jgi:hypothetical protein
MVSRNNTQRALSRREGKFGDEKIKIEREILSFPLSKKRRPRDHATDAFFSASASPSLPGFDFSALFSRPPSRRRRRSSKAKNKQTNKQTNKQQQQQQQQQQQLVFDTKGPFFGVGDKKDPSLFPLFFVFCLEFRVLEICKKKKKTRVR